MDVARLARITKSFGRVTAVRDVDLDVRAGEVHVLAGENGAGKSTLIKILGGAYRDFGGEFVFRGVSRRFRSPHEAVQAGIATIHQELSLVPTMSVVDNLFLGRESRGWWGTVAFNRQVSAATRILAEAGLPCSPHAIVGDLSLADQQNLEVARALARDAALFIFDEPTSAMHGPEVEALCRRIDGLRARGCGVVYITHKLDEIYRLADRITVLRDGRVVGTATPAALPKAALVEWMIGRDPARAARARPPSTAAPALTVRRLEVSHAVAGRPPVVDVSFDLRPGEIVGLAGLRGSGATEALQALFGASRSRVTGDVQVAGRPFTERTPRAAIERGVVWLTNDRKTTGLAPHQSVTHAVSLASLKRYSNAAGWMRGDEEAAAVGDLMQRFGFRAPSLDVPVGTLSGGNQQKVYLGRCLLARPRVLMLDEPTRGIDVGAKAEIHALMRAWASDGIAVLLATTDLEELFALCDRLLVLHAGRIAAELVPAAVTRDDVLAAAMGGQTARTA